MDEPGAAGFSVRFRRPSNSRIGPLCSWNGNLPGEPVSPPQLSLIYPSQVLTGLLPFHDLHLYAPVHAVLSGKRPRKPLDAESLGLSGTLWGLVQSCWSKSSSTRPTARRLFEYLSAASVTWIPPPMYPSETDDFDSTDSDSSSGSLRMPPAGLTVYELNSM